MLPTCCRNAVRLKPIGRQKLSRRCYTASGPSPSILFFGSDRFSVECLDTINTARSTDPALFQHIEVVTKPPFLEGRGKNAKMKKRRLLIMVPGGLLTNISADSGLRRDA